MASAVTETSGARHRDQGAGVRSGGEREHASGAEPVEQPAEGGCGDGEPGPESGDGRTGARQGPGPVLGDQQHGERHCSLGQPAGD
jgi:hypothetical protein